MMCLHETEIMCASPVCTKQTFLGLLYLAYSFDCVCEYICSEIILLGPELCLGRGRYLFDSLAMQYKGSGCLVMPERIFSEKKESDLFFRLHSVLKFLPDNAKFVTKVTTAQFAKAFTMATKTYTQKNCYTNDINNCNHYNSSLLYVCVSEGV